MSTPPLSKIPKAKPNLKPRSGVRYDYRLQTYTENTRENVFAMMGEQGFLFLGAESGGLAVFAKEK